MSPSLNELAQCLPTLMVRDERRLRRRVDAARRGRGADAGRSAIAGLAQEVAAAQRRIDRRRASVPEPRYPSGLPIVERKDDIAAAIRDHQVVIVAGETGSGKTTQIPKIALELGRGVRGMIGHTQPRRIAARTVAERIATELGSPLGTTVGYTVRFTDRSGEDSLVKIMTDGILLAELQRDRLLERYDTIIIDEAHERSLNIDFLLGYLKQLLPQRPDLKVVVTSATIDTERFSRHFDGAPVIEVSGRTYPVEVRYRPIGADDDDDRDQTQAICDAVGELVADGPGDVLVFLSGEREIRDTTDALRTANLPALEVVPLYARLPAAQQHRVFQPHAGRRVILATNVAETSLTVPGIRYVVDPGTARISRFSRRTKVQRLPIEAVSQASASQRAGRCGRVAPGTCIRLYSEEDLASRPAFTDPEILRTNLASVILQMAALELGAMASFPFVEPPEVRSITDGMALLDELGALATLGTQEGQRSGPHPAPGGPHPTRGGPHQTRSAPTPVGPRLTPIGRRLAQLPIDPRLGRMVIEAERHGCVREVLIIVAGLSIQDPREHRGDDAQAGAALHARFADTESDFIAYLNLWAYLQEQQSLMSSSQFRKLCSAEHLNFLRVREWQDLHSQLRRVARDLGLHASDSPAGRDQVHLSVLAGLLSHLGARDPSRNDYQGARNARFVIAPGSALAKKAPRWVMAAEMMETNRLWARTAARIDPAWVERVGAHLVRRTYGEPRWDPSRGGAVADERVTLYGLVLVAARRVDYGRIDPVVSRELFIRHALVEGEWRTHHSFFERNSDLVELVCRLEDRARRRDLVVDDDALYEFYDRRVGRDVVSVRHFDRWWDRTRAEEPDLLNFSMDMLIDPQAGPVSMAGFPDVWHHGDLELGLSYVFEPGADDDGVSVEVPLVVLNRVSPAGFDWQVPGLREDLVVALIRSLPKPVRRSFVPAPNYARAFLDAEAPEDGPLLERLAHRLPLLTGDPLPAGSWQLDRVPDHLRMTFRVVDDEGRTVGAGKDIEDLRAALRPRVREAIADAAHTVERTGQRAWGFASIARTVELDRSGYVVRGYPALVDEGDSVALRVLAGEAEQRDAMWAGTRRLLALDLGLGAKSLQRALTNSERLALGLSPYATVSDLVADCTAAALDGLIADHGGPAWDEERFTALRDAMRPEMMDATLSVVRVVGRILSAASAVEARLGNVTGLALAPAVADMRAQLSGLVRPGFVAATGGRRLPDVLRYLHGIERRLDKVSADAVRDAERMARIHELTHTYERAVRALPPGPTADERDEVRWMIEELRVSLFAQSLGTPRPASAERVRKAIDRLAG